MIEKFRSVFSSSENSINITDLRVIDNFISDPDFPWLISFPRTGSHWLRMMMELYFEKPSLVRVFYYKKAEDFTCYHRHDDKLSLKGIKNVIYIYRNPVDTIFSLACYYKEDIFDQNNLIQKTYSYSDHLAKWLVHEKFTSKKVVLTYERLQEHLLEEFKKLTDFYQVELVPEKLEKIRSQVSKKVLKRKTTDNTQIVNINSNYEETRALFKKKNSRLVIDKLLGKNPELESVFLELRNDFKG